MAHFISDAAGIQYITSDAIKNKPGGQELSDMLSYLDYTQGIWKQTGQEQSQINAEGGEVPPTTGQLLSSPKFATSEFDLAEMAKVYQLIIDNGNYLEIVSYPAFAVIANNRYDDPVPSYMINPMDNSQEPPVPYTWRTWVDETHDHLQEGTDWWVPMNSNTNNQDTIGSILLELVSNNYDIRDMSLWTPTPTP